MQQLFTIAYSRLVIYYVSYYILYILLYSEQLLAGWADRVISIEMFEHMKNYELLMRKVSRWIKPAGKVQFENFLFIWYQYGANQCYIPVL